MVVAAIMDLVLVIQAAVHVYGLFYYFSYVAEIMVVCLDVMVATQATNAFGLFSFFFSAITTMVVAAAVAKIILAHTGCFFTDSLCIYF